DAVPRVGQRRAGSACADVVALHGRRTADQPNAARVPGDDVARAGARATYDRGVGGAYAELAVGYGRSAVDVRADVVALYRAAAEDADLEAGDDVARAGVCPADDRRSAGDKDAVTLVNQLGRARRVR